MLRTNYGVKQLNKVLACFATIKQQISDKKKTLALFPSNKLQPLAWLAMNKLQIQNKQSNSMLCYN